MRRLTIFLVVILGTAIIASELLAQKVSGLPRIGLLTLGSPELSRGPSAAFREGMQSLGWIDGITFSTDYRSANGDPTRLSVNAADLVAAKVDVIVAFGPLPTQAARNATSTIPIVGATVDLGAIASLARPGGNVTGVTMMMQDVTAKQLAFLKEIVPQANKVGVLLQRDVPNYAQLMAELERAGARIGVSVTPEVVTTARELPRRFDEMTATGIGAYFIVADPVTLGMRADIVALALTHNLPGAAQLRSFVEAGVLISYGASLSAAHRRAAVFVDKILKGAKPADLPVEQPTTFELVVNSKAAKALGVTIPQSIFDRADEVIE